MNFGKCAFKDCHKEACTAEDQDGKLLLVCTKHYWSLRKTQDKAIIERVFASTSKGG